MKRKDNLERWTAQMRIDLGESEKKEVFSLARVTLCGTFS